MPSKAISWILLSSGIMVDLASRCAQVALPLVALAWTHSAAAAGLAAGSMAIPLVLSPWWTHFLRRRKVTSGALAWTTAAQGAGVLILPTAWQLHLPGVLFLVISGLVTGTARALTLPARAALLADVEQERTGSAVSVLAYQEAAARLTTVLGPALGAILVGAGHSLAMLITEGVALMVAALATALTQVQGKDLADNVRIPGGSGELWREFPEVIKGWSIRAIAGATWFAFGLGLALKGAHGSHPGLVYALGVGAYGIGSALATVWAGTNAHTVPTLARAAWGWVLNGAGWILAGVWDSPYAVIVGGVLGGVGAGIGFATITKMIAVSSSGPLRRTLLSRQMVIVETGTALGMLCGGTIIAYLGVGSTLILTGGLLSVYAMAFVRKRPSAIGRPQRSESEVS